MEKRKHRKAKETKEKVGNKTGEAIGNTQRQPVGHAEHSAGGLTEALRHQDELVHEKVDEKV